MTVCKLHLGISFKIFVAIKVIIISCSLLKHDIGCDSLVHIEKVLTKNNSIIVTYSYLLC